MAQLKHLVQCSLTTLALDIAASQPTQPCLHMHNPSGLSPLPHRALPSQTKHRQLVRSKQASSHSSSPLTWTNGAVKPGTPIPVHPVDVNVMLRRIPEYLRHALVGRVDGSLRLDDLPTRPERWGLHFSAYPPHVDFNMYELK